VYAKHFEGVGEYPAVWQPSLDHYSDTPETRTLLLGAVLKNKQGEWGRVGGYTSRYIHNSIVHDVLWGKCSDHKISFDKGIKWHDWGYLPKKEVQS
jgi:hypothetical protein